MTWVQLPPDEPGYYWFFQEHRGETDVEIVECRHILEADKSISTAYFKIGDGRIYTQSSIGFGSYWMGPIPVPGKAGSYPGLE